MHQEIAAKLDDAERERAPLQPLSSAYGVQTVADAYAIQRAWLELKRGRGGRVIGRKIGLTSKAMQELLGVGEPDYGFLLDTMLVADGASLARDDFLLPRIEPEIGFYLKDDLRGPGVTAEQVLQATEGVCAALELVDSRIADWKIKLVDTIADNASSARVVVSQRTLPLDGRDLAAEEVGLYRNGESVGHGTGAAVLGHPANAVAWLANALAAFDVALEAGQLVLPGAMCAAASVNAGDTFIARFGSLGEVSVNFR